MDKENVLETSFEQNDEIYNKKKEPVAPPAPQIGIDLENDLITNIVNAVESNKFDMGKAQSFTSVTRSRNELYDTLDFMAQATTLASVLETYAEDATVTNDQGDIIWCEASDPNVGKYITFLLNSLNVNKHIFKWTYSLCKYGDVYIRLYRKSDVDDIFFESKEKKKSSLIEDVVIRSYDNRDR